MSGRRVLPLWASRVRPALGGLRRDLQWTARLAGLILKVVAFHWRARRTARRTGDTFSLTSATRPRELRALLRLARGCHETVELGTATAWTAITLALDDPQPHVITYDPVNRPERERYLALVDPSVRERISFHQAAGGAGAGIASRVDFLYIDSSHERSETIEEFRAWQPASVVSGRALGVSPLRRLRDACQQLRQTHEAVGRRGYHRRPGRVPSPLSPSGRQ